MDPSKLSMRQIALAPCSPFKRNRRAYERQRSSCRQYGVRLHTHLAETKDEVEFMRQKYGKRPLEVMQDLNWTEATLWFATRYIFQ